MHVSFTRGTALGGVGNDALPGDVRELPDAQAQRLVAAGRAVPVAPPVASHLARKQVRIVPRGEPTQPKDTLWTSSATAH